MVESSKQLYILVFIVSLIFGCLMNFRQHENLMASTEVLETGLKKTDTNMPAASSVISDDGNNRSSAMMMSMIPSRDCPAIRGIHGEWVSDKDYFLKHLDYIPISGFRARQRRRRGEDHIEGWQRWVETRYPECDMRAQRPFDMESWCSTMKDLGIGRIFFVGDSLSWAQTVAFLGVINGQSPYEEGLNKKANRIYHCNRPEDPTGDYGGIANVTPGETFRLEFVRQNLSPNWNRTQSERSNETLREEFNHEGILCTCGPMLVYPLGNGHCPWTQRWLEDPTPTILVVNGGAHYHSEHAFQQMFDGFVDAVDHAAATGNRTQDLIFFRTTAPGHRRCWESKRPYKSYEDYAEKTTNLYDWNLMDFYNQYVRDRLRDRQKEQQLNSNQTNNMLPIHLLDIYNMTVLRPDGHVVGPKGDCLHYENPGPHDGWNQLLYSNLVDFATEKMSLSRKAPEWP